MDMALATQLLSCIRANAQLPSCADLDSNLDLEAAVLKAQKPNDIDGETWTSWTRGSLETRRVKWVEAVLDQVYDHQVDPHSAVRNAMYKIPPRVVPAAGASCK